MWISPQGAASVTASDRLGSALIESVSEKRAVKRHMQCARADQHAFACGSRLPCKVPAQSPHSSGFLRMLPSDNFPSVVCKYSRLEPPRHHCIPVLRSLLGICSLPRPLGYCRWTGYLTWIAPSPCRAPPRRRCRRSVPEG